MIKQSNMILKFIIIKTRLYFRKLKKEYQLYKYSKKYNCNFGERLSFLGPLRNIEIGQNTTINGYANFRFKDAKITIGRDCLVARNVTILTKGYILDKKQISTKHMLAKDVCIGNNVLLGSNIVIMPGIVIGNHAVVGSGSIVTKNIGDFEIWAGNPAKLIRRRIISE